MLKTYKISAWVTLDLPANARCSEDDIRSMVGNAISDRHDGLGVQLVEDGFATFTNPPQQCVMPVMVNASVELDDAEEVE